MGTQGKKTVNHAIPQSHLILKESIISDKRRGRNQSEKYQYHAISKLIATRGLQVRNWLQSSPPLHKRWQVPASVVERFGECGSSCSWIDWCITHKLLKGPHQVSSSWVRLLPPACQVSLLWPCLSWHFLVQRKPLLCIPEGVRLPQSLRNQSLLQLEWLSQSIVTMGAVVGNNTHDKRIKEERRSIAQGGLELGWHVLILIQRKTTPNVKIPRRLALTSPWQQLNFSR